MMDITIIIAENVATVFSVDSIDFWLPYSFAELIPHRPNQIPHFGLISNIAQLNINQVKIITINSEVCICNCTIK